MYRRVELHSESLGVTHCVMVGSLEDTKRCRSGYELHIPEGKRHVMPSSRRCVDLKAVEAERDDQWGPVWSFHAQGG